MSCAVELPHGQIIQILSKHMSAVWTEPFLFCRQTADSDLPPAVPLLVPGTDVRPPHPLTSLSQSLT